MYLTPSSQAERGGSSYGDISKSTFKNEKKKNAQRRGNNIKFLREYPEKGGTLKQRGVFRTWAISEQLCPREGGECEEKGGEKINTC